RFTGRDADLVEAYYKAQGLFRTDDMPDPVYSDTLELDMSEVEPAISGPRLPQERIPLVGAKTGWRQSLTELVRHTTDVDQAKVATWVAGGETPAATEAGYGDLFKSAA